MYRIPREHLNGFKLIAKLSGDQKQQLIDALSKIQVGEDPIDSGGLSKTLGIRDSETESLLLTINGALGTKNAVLDTPEEFSSDLVESYVGQTQDADFDQAEMIAYLVKLINASRGYLVTLKAQSLALERDRIATKFRLLTDVRPIFDDTDGQIILGSIIMQSLAITYIEEGKQKKISFAIDASDVADLRSILDRSVDKRTALQEAIKQARIKEIKLD